MSASEPSECVADCDGKVWYATATDYICTV